jgi:hypothetical protein
MVRLFDCFYIYIHLIYISTVFHLLKVNSNIQAKRNEANKTKDGTVAQQKQGSYSTINSKKQKVGKSKKKSKYCIY